MLTRALIVLLVVLNLGVALWWIARADPAPQALPQQPKDVPTLQLVEEAPAAAVMPPPSAPRPTMPSANAMPSPQPAQAVAAPAVATPAPAAPPQCFRLGPFADAAAAQAAIRALGARALRSRSHERAADNAASYTVFLPPQPDRAAAQALAQRIGAAGFDDFYVLNEGELANGIALGRYRKREGAERRQAALRAAGFDAQLAPVGGGASQWWADVAAPADATAQQLRTAASAAQAQALDCAGLR